MIALALPGHALTLPISGALLLRARRELEAGDAEAIGLGLLALALAPTRDQALSRLAAGWTLAQVGGEALDALAGSGHALGAILALARVASQAVLVPTQARPAAAPPPPPSGSDIPDPYPGRTLDTGRGPESWLAFAARGGDRDADALARWREAAAGWESAR